MSKLRLALLATSMIAGGVSQSNASAVTSHTDDFQVLEICDSNCGGSNGPTLSGHFELINNTHDFRIIAFAVGNPSGSAVGTTRPNWRAALTNIDFGSVTERAFTYADNGGINANGLGFGSDDSFTFSTEFLASPIAILAVGASGPVVCDGTTGSDAGCNVAVPEPGTLGLLGFGLAGLGLARRRRTA